MHLDKLGMGLQNVWREKKDHSEVLILLIKLCIDFVVLVEKNGSIHK